MSISHLYPSTRPSLSINFARSQKLDPRITFTRTTSGTRVGPDGYIEVIPEDQPRFDFDPVTGECLGLLIEEQRTNICTQSSSFSFSHTSNTTETNVFNPDGTAAIRRVALSTGNFHGTGADAANIDISGQAVGGTTDVTTSIFVKNYNNSNLRLLIGFAAYDGTTYRYLLGTIDTANPTFLATPSGTNGWGSGYAKVDDYGNGWYRYTFGGRYTKQTGYHTIAFVGEQIFSSTNQQFWFGDDVSGIYIWGKQRELGLFSSSYIPTSGSTVTRTPDNAKIDGENFSSWYNQSEGTFLINGRTDNPSFQRSYGVSVFNIDEIPSLLNRLSIRMGNTFMNTGGTTQFGYYQSPTAGVPYKVSVAFKTNSALQVLNGVASGNEDTVVTPPTNLNIMEIGKVENNTSLYINGHIAQITYYPKRLTNTQLINLTK